MRDCDSRISDENTHKVADEDSSCGESQNSTGLKLHPSPSVGGILRANDAHNEVTRPNALLVNTLFRASRTGEEHHDCDSSVHRDEQQHGVAADEDTRSCSDGESSTSSSDWEQFVTKSVAPPPCAPSVGSIHHGNKELACKPCRFFARQGCKNGYSCEFCHLCTLEDSKRLYREMRHYKKNKMRV